MLRRVGDDEISRSVEGHSVRIAQRSSDDRCSIGGTWPPFLHSIVAKVQDEHESVGIESDRRGTTELVGPRTGIRS